LKFSELRWDIFIVNMVPVRCLPVVTLPPKSEPRDRWLTREEARRLRKAAMKWPHLYRFVIIGLMTGSRSGAIRGLQWSWIDLNARVMRRRAFGEAEDSRKKTPPVRISARLARLLRRWKRKDACPWVVHYNGKPIDSLKGCGNRLARKPGYPASRPTRCGTPGRPG
jgi:integrase